MMSKLNFNSDFRLGFVGLMASGLILFVWIPLDVETGLIEKVRSQLTIGDSLAPSLAATVLMIGSLLLIFQTFQTRGGAKFSWNNLKFIALLLVLLGFSLSVMRWAGPILAQLLSEDYRSLRDTIPWKYIGYFSGGLIMVFGLMSMMEHRFRWHILIISVLAVLAMIIAYDLPFENLLLPPNGDV